MLWKGAPIPAFRPSRGDVREMEQTLTRHTKIQTALDSCTGASHCHHEKTIVIDDRVAFVGGIDLTLDGGDPYDTPNHRARGGIGWHDVAARIEGPAVRDVAEHFRLRWQSAAGETLPPPATPEAAGDVELQVVRTLPAGAYRAVRHGDYSILESYVGALRSAERLVYLENQFLWSPEIVDILADKLRDPPTDDFRVVVLLPARANDGADISRGQVAALIDADDGDDRFLACTVYAREGKLRDIVYVHAKIGIVDDRWLTVGSANLNAHSLLHDTEMNVVTHDERLARETRLRLWAEHLERDEKIRGRKHGDDRRRALAADRRPSSSTGSSTASRSRTGWCGYRVSRAAPPAPRPAAEPPLRRLSRALDAGLAGRLVCVLGDPDGPLDRRTEGEEAAAEGDRADREPGPAEGEAGDDVREPVDAEHHAAAGDADGDRRPHSPRAAPAPAVNDGGRATSATAAYSAAAVAE